MGIVLTPAPPCSQHHKVQGSTREDQFITVKMIRPQGLKWPWCRWISNNWTTRQFPDFDWWTHSLFPSKYWVKICYGAIPGTAKKAITTDQMEAKFGKWKSSATGFLWPILLLGSPFPSAYSYSFYLAVAFCCALPVLSPSVKAIW